MKPNSTNVIYNITIFILGVILILLHNRIGLMDSIIVLLGIIFLVPSVVSFIGFMFNRQRSRMNRISSSSFSYGISASVGGICFGLILILKPQLFIGILAYLFAILLIIGGIFQIITLTLAKKYSKIPLWLYILPFLITMAGISILLSSIKDIESAILLITGISLIAFSINMVLEMILYRAHRKLIDS